MATYGVTENTTEELSQLIAGGVHIQREITMAASCGDLSRGTVLEMVSVGSGQWRQLTADNGANARAILLEAVEDSASTQKVQAYFVGKYRIEDMIWPAAITTQQKRAAIVGLQDKGIIIDEAILAIPTTTTTTTTTSSTTTTTTTTTTAP
jgi:hypothetical protein